MSTQTWIAKIELERARDKKQKETNFVGRDTLEFYSGGEKMRLNASGHQGENKR